MSDDVLIAVIGGAVTVAVGVLAAAVALWVHHAAEKSRRRDAEVDQQRLMVTRMLDTIDRAIQTRITPAIFRPWRDPTVDLMLALPRLLLELPIEDLAVAQWAGAQVQRAAATIRRKQFIARISGIEARLISWHRGETSVAWFQEQLRREPFDPHFRLRKRTRWAITLRDIVVGAGNLGALVIAGKALRSFGRP